MIIDLVFAAFLGQDPSRIARELNDAIQRQSAKEVETLSKQLVDLNNQKAAHALAQALDTAVAQANSKYSVYWILAKAAANFSSAEALDEVAKYITAGKKPVVARDLMFMLNSNNAHDIIFLCLKVLDKSPDDLKVMAIDHLGALQHREAVEPLIEALKKFKSVEVKKRLARALAAITGQDFGENITNWEGWWAANKDKPLDGAAGGSFSGGNVITGLDKPRANEINRTTRLPETAILVITGGEHDPRETKQKGGRVFDHCFDHIEKVLAHFNIPHTVATKEEVEKVDFKFDGRMMMLINCTGWREHCVCPDCAPSNVAGGNRLFRCVCKAKPEVHIPLEYKLSDLVIRKLRFFVDSGGYLFSEDWVLEEVLVRRGAWPDLVKAADNIPKDTNVNVLPKSGSTSHPYLKRIFAKPPKLLDKGTALEPAFDEIKHMWKIDLDSPKVRVLDSKLVTTLMVSNEIGPDEALAITFSSGDSKDGKVKGGRVLHVMSHFGKQSSESDEYTLQNLLVNFLIDATDRYMAPKPAAK